MRRTFVRFASALALLGLVASPAVASKSPTEINTEIDTNFADNKQGLITEAILRATLKDIAAAQTSLYYLVSTCTANQWVSGFAITGAPNCTRPSFSNLSGSISAGQMIAPGLGTLGGVYSSTAGANQFATGIDTTGAVLYAQPAFSNLSGTIAAAQLIAPGAATFGAVKSSSAPANQFATGINTSGVLTYAQPAFSNLSGTIAAAQLIAPGASTFGAVKSSTAPTNQFAKGIDMSGAVTYTRPDAADVTYTASGTGAFTRTIFVKSGEVVTVTDFATCNGVADASASILNAANSLGSTGGTIFVPNSAKCLIDTNLTLPTNVQIAGPYNFTGAPGPYASMPFGSMGGALIVNSAATITLGHNGGLRGLLVYRKGMTFPANDASAYAGTAITAGGVDTFVERSMVIGFNKIFYSTGNDRIKLYDLFFDGVNGIEIHASNDYVRLFNTHGWPFGTAGGSGGYAGLERSGKAHWIQGVVDGAKIVTSLTYGYAVGFQLDDVSNFSLIDTWADNTPTRTGANGYVISGAGSENSLFRPQSSNNANAFFVNLSAGVGMTILNAQVWGSQTNVGLALYGGDVNLGGGSNFHFAGTAIYTNDAVSKLSVNGTRFEGLTNVILPNVATSNIRFGNDNTIIGSAGAVAAGANMICATVTPAAGVAALPPNGECFNFARGDGAGLTTLQGGWAGRRVTLIFGSGGLPGTITSASTPATNELRLAGGSSSVGANFVPSYAGTTLSLVHAGQWYETGRSGDVGIAPTASTCGTGPAVDSNSSPLAGKVTFGTGATACTLTFATAYPAAAFCTVTPMAQPAAVGSIPYISAQSRTAFTISGGVASAAYTYNCQGK